MTVEFAFSHIETDPNAVNPFCTEVRLHSMTMLVVGVLWCRHM
ncbi:hypothetical protein [Paenibacillus sp. MER TA 81-3]|nr:hypothetical protein [Paenibacillus sp. MER TA 81-3]